MKRFHWHNCIFSHPIERATGCLSGKHLNAFPKHDEASLEHVECQDHNTSLDLSKPLPRLFSSITARMLAWPQNIGDYQQDAANRDSRMKTRICITMVLLMTLISCKREPSDQEIIDHLKDLRENSAEQIQADYERETQEINDAFDKYDAEMEEFYREQDEEFQRNLEELECGIDRIMQHEGGEHHSPFFTSDACRSRP